jgi:hypothetical protein
MYLAVSNMAGGSFLERAVALLDGLGTPPTPRCVGGEEGLGRGHRCFGVVVGVLLEAFFLIFSPIFAIGRGIGPLLDLLSSPTHAPDGGADSEPKLGCSLHITTRSTKHHNKVTSSTT